MLEGNREEQRMAAATTVASGDSSSSSGVPIEELLDQLKILLDREKKYLRTDYIGSFAADVVENSSRNESKLDPSSYRRSKQIKTCVNTSVHSQSVTTITPNRKSLFTEHHRALLCEWAVEVVNYYGFPKHSVEITMNILDRYLSSFVGPEERTMETLHLLTLTCLYLSLKLTTLQRPAPSVFVRLSRSRFLAAELERTELLILQGLQWNVHPPTALEFLTLYIQTLAELYPPDVLQALESSAADAIHATFSDYVWVRFTPSVVAVAALSWSVYHFSVGGHANPITELHHRGIPIPIPKFMQALEYFYIRCMYASSRGDVRTKAALSPISILDDDPVVIHDED